MTTTRHDRLGPIVLLAEAEGWAMIQRPGATPFVLLVIEWRRLPIVNEDGRHWSASRFGVFDLRRRDS